MFKLRNKTSWSQWVPLSLRLVIGFGFMAHGWAKLSRGPSDFAKLLAQLRPTGLRGQPPLYCWSGLADPGRRGGFVHRPPSLAQRGVVGASERAPPCRLNRLRADDPRLEREAAARMTRGGRGISRRGVEASCLH